MPTSLLQYLQVVCKGQNLQPGPEEENRRARCVQKPDVVPVQIKLLQSRKFCANHAAQARYFITMQVDSRYTLCCVMKIRHFFQVVFAHITFIESCHSFEEVCGYVSCEGLSYSAQIQPGYRFTF